MSKPIEQRGTRLDLIYDTVRLSPPLEVQEFDTRVSTFYDNLKLLSQRTAALESNPTYTPFQTRTKQLQDMSPRWKQIISTANPSVSDKNPVTTTYKFIDGVKEDLHRFEVKWENGYREDMQEIVIEPGLHVLEPSPPRTVIHVEAGEVRHASQWLVNHIDLYNGFGRLFRQSTQSDDPREIAANEHAADTFDFIRNLHPLLQVGLLEDLVTIFEDPSLEEK